MIGPARLKEICKAALPAMKQRLGLSHWHITLFTGAKLPRDESSVTDGRVHPKPLYGRATILLDPSHIDTKAEALGTLRHELLHLLLDHMECYNEQAVAAIESQAATDALEESHNQAIERTILQFERTLDAAGLTPARLARPLIPTIKTRRAPRRNKRGGRVTSTPGPRASRIE